MAMSIDDRQELALELYRSRQAGMSNAGTTGTLMSSGTSTMGRRTMGTMSRKQNQQANAAASLGKSPPRPSPASVAYHSDEESLKCYDENPDDSSVTEKPSEVSSSDSQVTTLFKFLLIVFEINKSESFRIRKAKTKASDRTRIRSSITMPTSTTRCVSRGNVKSLCAIIRATPIRSPRAAP